MKFNNMSVMMEGTKLDENNKEDMAFLYRFSACSLCRSSARKLIVSKCVSGSKRVFAWTALAYTAQSCQAGYQSTLGMRFSLM